MTRPRVDFVSPPMSGHLHPILGLARAVARVADVRVISTAAAMPEIAAAGLSGHALLSGADAIIAAVVNPSRPVRSHPLRLYEQFRANIGLLTDFHRELLQFWRDAPPHLVIADFTVPTAGSAAIAKGIHWWTSAPSPCAMETPDGPPAYLGGWKPSASWPGHVRDQAGRAAIRGFKRGVHWMFRDALAPLGFPSVYRADGYESIYSPERVLALGLSALEFPRTYSSAVEFVGPVLYTPPSDTPSPHFVEGRRHVLVTTGTHLPWRKEALVAAIRQAARDMPTVEFHVSDGDRTSARHEVVANMHRLGFVSYARDLARYDLVVHHGGSGILYWSLAAGIPAVVVPADFDQFDNAARLEVAGAGLQVRRISALPGAIARALGDAALRGQARRFQGLVPDGQTERRVVELVESVHIP